VAVDVVAATRVEVVAEAVVEAEVDEFAFIAVAEVAAAAGAFVAVAALDRVARAVSEGKPLVILGLLTPVTVTAVGRRVILDLGISVPDSDSDSS
jgi:hypothetical protein